MMSSKNSLLTVMATGGAIGLAVGTARGLIQERHGGWMGFIRGLTASVTVAVLTGWLLEDLVVAETLKAGIIGLCAYVADDILMGLKNLSTALAQDPRQFLREMVATWRGQR